MESLLMRKGARGITGNDVFTLIRQRNPRLRFLFASGQLPDDQKTLLLKGAIHGFVQKPYRPEELLVVLKKPLGRKS